MSDAKRTTSIDLLRGVIMVIMALDHTRDFVCNIPFEPENIDQTWAFYFPGERPCLPSLWRLRRPFCSAIPVPGLQAIETAVLS